MLEGDTAHGVYWILPDARAGLSLVTDEAFSTRGCAGRDATTAMAKVKGKVPQCAGKAALPALTAMIKVLGYPTKRIIGKGVARCSMLEQYLELLGYEKMMPGIG